jgi:hypothetical protein
MRTKFDTEQKSFKFLLETMTAVPSAASNMGSDTEFILRGRSFIYMMDNRGPWGTLPYEHNVISPIMKGYIMHILYCHQ